MNKDVKDFMVQYFQDLDFDYWEKRLNFALDKIKALKKPRSKAPYLIDMYAIYMQLLEIVFTNLLILSGRERLFFTYLFSSNTWFLKTAKMEFRNKEFLNWLMDNLVFGINGKTEINDYEQKRNDHLKILEECVKDYFNDYEFLNAYKHGYRVHAKSDVTMSINGMIFDTFDTVLTYYKKERDIQKDLPKKNHQQKEDRSTIYEHQIGIKHKRVITKCYFILQMLKNSQAVFLAQETSPGKKTLISHYTIEGREEWAKSLGSFRIKQPLFHITTPRNK